MLRGPSSPRILVRLQTGVVEGLSSPRPARECRCRAGCGSTALYMASTVHSTESAWRGRLLMLLLLASLLLHFTTAVTDSNGSAGLAQQHEGREVSSFNFGWRWRRDRPDAAGPASCPSLAPHNGLECPGLSQRRCAQSEFPGPAVGIPCNDTSTAGQCEMDCCADPGCQLRPVGLSREATISCFMSLGLGWLGYTGAVSCELLGGDQRRGHQAGAEVGKQLSRHRSHCGRGATAATLPRTAAVIGVAAAATLDSQGSQEAAQSVLVGERAQGGQTTPT